MKQEQTNETQRIEIIVLEDDPQTLAMLTEQLQQRGVLVHPFSQSAAAFEEMINASHISVLLTDIEIREPFPDGPRSDLQGYDVVNRLYEQAPQRPFTAVVMTALDQESALDSANLFQVRPLFFSKRKWQQDSAAHQQVFDQLATILTDAAQSTPNLWQQQVMRDYPKSRWVCEKAESGKRIPALWEWYCKLWFSPNWPSLEKQISRSAEKIVSAYLDGDVRKLRGDHLSLVAAPNENSFKEYLIGRRVVYALAALEPGYWETYIRGEAVKEEEPLVPPDIWQELTSDQVRNLINQIHAYAAQFQLEKVHHEYGACAKKIEQLEQAGSENEEYRRLLHRQAALAEKLQQAQKAVAPAALELGAALTAETETVRQTLIPFLRFWGADFSKISWSKIESKTSGGNDPLTQTLLLLGIRKQDLEGSDPQQWKLLLPEERKWLEKFV